VVWSVSSSLPALIRKGLLLLICVLCSGTAAHGEALDGGAPVLNVEVAELMQHGDVANCGPTAAAMVLAHAGIGADPQRLRDRIGSWSWRRFPLRALSVSGRSSGMTSPTMMAEVLEAFGGQGRFRALRHPFLPSDAFALIALRSALSEGRPVLMMVESPILWGTEQAGLHWIVVRGAERDTFIFNDPADGEEHRVSAERLWRAWRLHPLWRRLPGVDAFTAFVLDAPLPCPDDAMRIASLHTSLPECR